MKIIITVLSVLFLCAPCIRADWQSTLENAGFDYVITFDNLQDWTGTASNSQAYTPSDTPKTTGGADTRIVGFQYETIGGTPVSPWIGAHDNYEANGSSKSLSMSFQNPGFGPAAYGPADLFLYVGNGDATSGTRNDGYENLYVFYWIKLRHDRIDITGTGYYWIPTGVNNEYYLSAGESPTNPSLFMPNSLIINGTIVNDPIPIDGVGMPAAQYTNYAGDLIGSLGSNQWDYGDPAGNGWKTLVVKLADGTDPDTKADGYILYENGALTLDSDGTIYHPIGVWKHLMATQGFWYDKSTYPYVHHYNQTWTDGCVEQNERTYGVNFSILNWDSYPTSTRELNLVAQSPSSTAIWYNNSCYFYAYNTQPMYWDSNGTLGNTLSNYYLNNTGFYIEYNFNKGTCGVANGSITVTYYTEAGVSLGSETVSNYKMCDNPQEGGAIDLDNPYNRINLGGNRFGNGYPYGPEDSWDNRYYIDDFIVNDSEIAPTYFALLNGSIACYPDSDNDLYPGPGSEMVETTCSAGYYIASHFTALTVDCNDSNAAINPGATETCGNSIDEDCSGADCSVAPEPVDGVCGSAEGVPVSSPPTTNLCAVGFAGAVTKPSDSYIWDCVGTDGGTTDSCSALYSAPVAQLKKWGGKPILSVTTQGD